jgi:hypothetical protein
MANIVQLSWQESNYDIVEMLKGTAGIPRPRKTVFSTSSLKERTVGKGIASEYFDITLVTALHEDIGINIQSEFGDIGDNIPAVKGIIDSVKGLQASVTGTTNDVYAMFGFQQWKNTSPIQISLTLNFYTDKSAWFDVWLPIVSLASLTTLSVITGKDGTPTSTYRTPGISMGNIKQATGSKKTAADATEAESSKRRVKNPRDERSDSKLIDVLIPGVIALNDAIVESAVPTFSHQKTKSGAPLSGSIQLTIKSLLPAYDRMLTAVSAEALRMNQRSSLLSKVTNLFR